MSINKIFRFMPQFSPLWFINLISWTFAIISFVTWYVQSIILPNILRLKLSRKIMEMKNIMHNH
jgi:hypothetical protein